ncbi:AzlC family protein [Natrialba hulunbeirensis JCM 10989]|uniref:AzlC family protein n=1 Tax=Natrialba hulunbeirensis JCM 10989 TaxID=1227493 RepID=M0AFP2_9EURY|nr:AzlC family ABC transporter permease [Natrialba hulunbeirensis]ELY96163.1 AzlC family protein [Natrialba hulunbeirensis JCM 10989]
MSGNETASAGQDDSPDPDARTALEPEPQDQRLLSRLLHADFRAGARDSIGILLGLIPFALVFGIAADSAGLSTLQTIAMSAGIFAGTAQLVMVELIDANAGLVIIVFTGLVINLRMLMYSASIAPHFTEYGKKTRAYLAYFLTDHVYAVSIGEYADEDSDRNKRLYYLGLGVSIWLVWVATTIAGFVLGAGIPDSWNLQFAIPLVFLAILIPAIDAYPQLVAALTSALVAIVAALAVSQTGLPEGADLLIAASVGIAAGVAAEEVMGQ